MADKRKKPDIVERSYFDIEDEEIDEDPVHQAHTDLPGEGDADFEPLPRDIDRQLAEALAAEQERQRRAERALEDIGYGYGAMGTEEIGADPSDIDQAPPNLDAQQLADLLTAGGLPEDRAYYDELKLCSEYEEATKEALRIHRRELPTDMDPHDLAQTGWGVIFARDADPAVKHHLRRLIEHREEQAGHRFKELTYIPPESARTFLWYRHGVSPGILDTDLMPYYLLIVGDPKTIPFDFQYQLNINHAVGRIHFEDPADYSRYAESVVAAETRGVDLPRRATIFAAEKDGDRSTALLAEHLVKPLVERLTGYSPDWEVDVWRRDRAYKKNLGRLLGGESTPGLLLVACHGKKLPPGHQDQEAYQGALLCQDWLERERGTRTDERLYFHAGEVAEDARLCGLITFLFACYGAGTPLEDNFPHETREGTLTKSPQPRALALKPFLGRLPQALLSRGVLAVVGHVDRGWSLSFTWALQGKPTEAVRSLEDSLKQLLKGQRLGHAMRPLYRRYTALAAHLAEPIERIRYGKETADKVLAMQWTALNDARNFIILGDPAVRLQYREVLSPNR